MSLLRHLPLGILTLVLACSPQTGDTRPEGAAPVRAVVDSAVPREEALRRFREEIPEVTALSGGERSEEALVAAFVTALDAADTLRLRDLLMTRAEYAWLYYPTNPQGLPPYDLAPALLWFLLEERGTQGLADAFERVSGKSLAYVSHACAGEASLEGANVIRGPCSVRIRVDGGGPWDVRLFGPIIERGGRYKFVNFANKLD